MPSCLKEQSKSCQLRFLASKHPNAKFALDHSALCKIGLLPLLDPEANCDVLRSFVYGKALCVCVYEVAAESRMTLKKSGQHRSGNETFVKREKLVIQLFGASGKQCSMESFETDEEFEEAVAQKMVDFAEPFVVEQVSWIEKALEDGQSLKRKLSYFQSSFAQANTVLQSGRGQYMLRDEPDVREKLLQYVETNARYSPCEADVPMAVTEATVKDKLLCKLGVGCIGAFGLLPGKQHLGTEYGESGSIRLLSDGERLSGCVDIRMALEFMKAEKGKMTGKGGVPTMSDLQSFLMNLSGQQLEKLMREHPRAVQVVKMVPKMLVYVPQGRIIFEQALGVVACFGLRATVLTTAKGAKAGVEQCLNLYGNMPAFKPDSPEFLCLQLAKQHACEAGESAAAAAAAAAADAGTDPAAAAEAGKASTDSTEQGPPDAAVEEEKGKAEDQPADEA